MDPIMRVRDYLLDNVGHLTYPGNASFDPEKRHWLVPIRCRTERGDVTLGDIELDQEGHIVFAPSKEDMIARLSASATPTTQPVAGVRK